MGPVEFDHSRCHLAEPRPGEALAPSRAGVPTTNVDAEARPEAQGATEARGGALEGCAQPGARPPDAWRGPGRGSQRLP